MARDHTLALSLPSGSAVLRLYRWVRPTLSLGRNEPAVGRYDLHALRRLGVDVVRRPTGGRAVLHRRELTYAAVLPARTMGGLRSAYVWINQRIAEGLASLGVPAEIARGCGAASPLDAGPCFRGAAEGEVVAEGRKLVGSAQARMGNVLLQHGSILLADDQDLLRRVFTGDLGGIDRPATVSELLGRDPEEGELERALAAAFGIGPECTDGPLCESLDDAQLEERYRSEAWTWRR